MLLNFPSLRTATAFLALTAMAACSSKKDDATPAAPTLGMSWTVDGNNVTATTAVGQSASATIETLAGATSNAGGVFLDVPKTAGTYTITSTSDAGAAYIVTPAQGSSQSYEATSGTIVVTGATTTNLTGTFTFTGTLSGGTATKTLSNGKFNVNF